jgi:hypothetical protein
MNETNISFHTEQAIKRKKNQPSKTRNQAKSQSKQKENPELTSQIRRIRTTEERLGIYKSVPSTKHLYHQPLLLTDWLSCPYSRVFMWKSLTGSWVTSQKHFILHEYATMASFHIQSEWSFINHPTIRCYMAKAVDTTMSNLQSSSWEANSASVSEDNPRL